MIPNSDIFNGVICAASNTPRVLLLGPLLAALVACGDAAASDPEVGDPTAPAKPSAERDESDPALRAPAVADDVVRIEVQPLTTEAGQEVVMCEYLAPLEQDIWVTGYETYQGLGGHHLVLFRALKKKDPGTFSDCSSSESMKDALPVLSPTEAPGGGYASVHFPSDTALLLKAGTQLIAQVHYINASDTKRSYRDIADLHTIDATEAASRRALHVYATASVGFEVPAGAQLSVGYDCELPFDMTFTTVLPHMHEYGAHFSVLLGPADGMRMMVDVPEWTPEMRDLPPAALFPDPEARAESTFAKGDMQHTECAWRNPGERALKFPEEMCATFAYFYSDDPEASDRVCTVQ